MITSITWLLAIVPHYQQFFNQISYYQHWLLMYLHVLKQTIPSLLHHTTPLTSSDNLFYPRFITFKCYHWARQLQVQHLWPLTSVSLCMTHVFTWWLVLLKVYTGTWYFNIFITVLTSLYWYDFYMTNIFLHDEYFQLVNIYKDNYFYNMTDSHCSTLINSSSTNQLLSALTDYVPTLVNDF